MSILKILLLSISLAADAFSASVCTGLTINNYKIKYSIIVGSFFGFFQFIMPLIGVMFTKGLGYYLVSINDYIVFFVFFILGFKMIIDSFKKDGNDFIIFNIKRVGILAFATSIDALVLGIVYSNINDIVLNMFIFLIVGIITFLFSFFGVKIGYKFGCKYKDLSQVIGGVILISLAIESLL